MQAMQLSDNSTSHGGKKQDGNTRSRAPQERISIENTHNRTDMDTEVNRTMAGMMPDDEDYGPGE
jgi:hypothetical protein